MKIHPLEVFWTPFHGQRARVEKRPHHVRPHRFTHFLLELLSFVRYFRTFGQKDSVDLTFYVKRKPQSSPTQR